MNEATRAGMPGELHFSHFRLVGPHGPLFAAGRAVELPRKPMALLWLLASRRGEIVTKDEVLAAVWPRVVVSEGAIASTLRELRRVLHDDARTPRFIATAHRIGYRFVATVSAHAPARTGRAEGVDAAAPGPSDTPAAGPASTAETLVGRTSESARLWNAYSRAAGGQRQLVFVTGEAGIGKSRLVRSFMADLQVRAADTPRPAGRAADLVAHGQCIEHYGAGEPYLPLLEALTRLCRQPGGNALQALLRKHAPTWAAQLPGVFGADPEGSTHHDPGSGQVQRMPREMADVAELASEDRVLVLALEDMHWSDPSTVDCLAMLARRQEPARLLIIVTCRPAELVVTGHPLKQVKQDLVTRGMASEIALGALGPAAVEDYVTQRLQHRHAAPDVAAAVFRRSQGHPLFMVHMADELQRSPDEEATLDEASVPSGVGELLEAQLARLPGHELALLEAASVAGAEFAAATVAAALQGSVDETESVLEALARNGQFIEARGLARWRDGSASGLYGFRHELVRDCLYRRLGSARRMRLHGAVGARLALAYAGHGSEIAAELALHFENAHDAWQAALHRTDAGEKALHRYAHCEALAHATKGLLLLEGVRADRPGHAAAELRLRLIEGAALLTVRGFSAPEVEATYTRALALGITLNDSSAIGPTLSGLFNLYLTRAAFAQVQRVADQVLAQLQRQPDPVLAMLAHNVRGTTRLFVGDAVAALTHVGQTLDLYDPQAHAHLAATYGEDPAIVAHHYAVLSQWVLGDAEAAERHLRAGFKRAIGLAHAFGEAQMLWAESLIALDGGDVDRAERSTARLDALCEASGFPLWRAGGRILRGATLAEMGRRKEGRRLAALGLSGWREANTLLTLPHALALSARVEALNGDLEAALGHLDEAQSVTAQTGERWYEPELHRMRGQVLLQLLHVGAEQVQPARESFQRALAQARAQKSRLFEQRAAADLLALGQPLDAAAEPLPAKTPRALSKAHRLGEPQDSGGE